MEPELAPGAVLEPEDDEPEDDEPEGDEREGEDGRVLGEDRSRDAPEVEFGPLSQPYRPVTATAIGRRITADLFNNFIGELLSVKG